MKIHWGLWVALVALVLIIVVLSARREGYAPPRDENTNPPYTESVGNVVTTSNNLPYVDSTSNVVRIDNQTQIYKDMAGMDYQIQAGNPILNFIQGDPSSNVIYGDFVPHESDGGSASMYAISDESMIAQGETVSNTSNLVAVPENPSLTKQVYGVDVSGNIFGSAVTTDQERELLFNPEKTTDRSQYIPALTSPTIPFLGTTISASESQASATSPGAAQ